MKNGKNDIKVKKNNAKQIQSIYTAIQFKQKNTKIKWTAQTLANDFRKMTWKVQTH